MNLKEITEEYHKTGMMYPANNGIFNRKEREGNHV